MSDTDAPDITTNWSLRRGSSSERTSRFHLDVVVDAQFIDPTRDEVRTALLQTLDEALGVNTDTAEVDGIDGWADNEILLVEETTTEIALDDMAGDELTDLLERLLEMTLPGKADIMRAHNYIRAV